MRKEATPRKRNFREMAALLELCGVRSGGRVTTILKRWFIVPCFGLTALLVKL